MRPNFSPQSRNSFNSIAAAAAAALAQYQVLRRFHPYLIQHSPSSLTPLMNRCENYNQPHFEALKRDASPESTKSSP